MGFFDFLFGKKKDKNIQVQHSEEDPNQVKVFAKVSDGTSEGLSMDQLNVLNVELETVIKSNDLGKMSQHNAKLMSSGAYDAMVDFNQTIIERYPNTNASANSHNFIGVAYFFKKDYAKAVDHYYQAMQGGMDMGMMDDNIWEATEALYQQTGDVAHLKHYKELLPDGNYVKKANKMMG